MKLPLVKMSHSLMKQEPFLAKRFSVQIARNGLMNSVLMVTVQLRVVLPLGHNEPQQVCHKARNKR